MNDAQGRQWSFVKGNDIALRREKDRSTLVNQTQFEINYRLTWDRAVLIISVFAQTTTRVAPRNQHKWQARKMESESTRRNSNTCFHELTSCYICSTDLSLSKSPTERRMNGKSFAQSPFSSDLSLQIRKKPWRPRMFLPQIEIPNTLLLQLEARNIW